MEICIVGAGYVGTVAAACLSRMGHTVVLVDGDGGKVTSIQRGKAPFVEEGLEALLAANVEAGRLRATTSTEEAVAASRVTMICVGTPSLPDGAVNLRYIEEACRAIAMGLRRVVGFHLVAVRSTVLPGTTRKTLLPLLESLSEKRAGQDFGLCFNPEFLREGSAVLDFHHPARTVIGGLDDRSSRALVPLYEGLPAPVVVTGLEEAEMVKYADNAFHAIKVSFANEIGSLCKASGIDGREVMRIFCLDNKLNLSPYYLKPGISFGGSCLPKDLRALTFHASRLDLDLPLLHSVVKSNESHMDRAIAAIRAKGKRKVGVLGVSFKAGTDDLRESPIVGIIQALLGEGHEVRLYDPHLSPEPPRCTNRWCDFIYETPGLICREVTEVIDHAETLVVGLACEEFRRLLQQKLNEAFVVDLVGIGRGSVSPSRYEGICW